MHSLILTSLSFTPHRNVYCSLSKCSGFVYLLQGVLGKKHGPNGLLMALLSCHTANQTYCIVLLLDVYLSLYHSVVHSCTQLIPL